jgi:branched-chain amino acid transport system ATP-binding protein
MSLLKAKQITVRFGGVQALNRLELNVGEGEIYGLIGPNGSGKTTFINVVAGFFRPTSGSIFFLGDDITGLKPDQVTSRGISRTFQNIRLFKTMTVLENVAVGYHPRGKSGLIDSIIRSDLFHSEEKATWERAEELLEFFGLWGRRNDWAGGLPYGQQRLLELARAMASNPKILLIDEPAAGMNEQETKQLIELFLKINEQGYTMLIIEHDMKLIMNISQRISVLDFGEKIAEGTPEEIQRNSRVIEAYLGYGAGQKASSLSH